MTTMNHAEGYSTSTTGYGSHAEAPPPIAIDLSAETLRIRPLGSDQEWVDITPPGWVGNCTAVYPGGLGDLIVQRPGETLRTHLSEALAGRPCWRRRVVQWVDLVADDETAG